MKQNLVQLTDGVWVNPAYVTCVERRHGSNTQKDKVFTRAWVVKDAGYNTGSYELPGDQVARVAALLNQSANHQQSFPKNEASPHHH